MIATLKKIILSLLCPFSYLVNAQENNYWSHQYGAKSTLLAGAAVAAYFDNGAIFYNPATLCFKDSGNISLSANLYQAEFQNVTNGLGDGINFGSTNYNFAPQIVSGNKKLGKKLEVEFIVLSKTNLDFAYNVSHYNIYPLTYYNSQALSQYIGNFSFRNRIIEDWAGIAMSFKLNEKWGFGLTNFFGYRFQKYSSAMNATAI